MSHILKLPVERWISHNRANAMRHEMTLRADVRTWRFGAGDVSYDVAFRTAQTVQLLADLPGRVLRVTQYPTKHVPLRLWKWYSIKTKTPMVIINKRRRWWTVEYWRSTDTIPLTQDEIEYIREHAIPYWQQRTLRRQAACGGFGRTTGAWLNYLTDVEAEEMAAHILRYPAISDRPITPRIPEGLTLH